MNGIPRFTPPRGLFGERTAPPTVSQWEKAKVNRYWPVGVNADFNRDGKVDLFMVEWFPELPSRYFANTTPGGGFIEIDVDPPGRAFGALVKVYEAVPPSGTRGALYFCREVLSTESYGGGMLRRLHVGLGQRSRVVVEVIAPWSGRTLTVTNVRPGQTVRVTLPQ